jgi:hypothetical protein
MSDDDKVVDLIQKLDERLTSKMTELINELRSVCARSGLAHIDVLIAVIVLLTTYVRRVSDTEEVAFRKVMKNVIRVLDDAPRLGAGKREP